MPIIFSTNDLVTILSHLLIQQYKVYECGLQYFEQFVNEQKTFDISTYIVKSGQELSDLINSFKLNELFDIYSLQKEYDILKDSVIRIVLYLFNYTFDVEDEQIIIDFLQLLDQSSLKLSETNDV